VHQIITHRRTAHKDTVVSTNTSGNTRRTTAQKRSKSDRSQETEQHAKIQTRNEPRPITKSQSPIPVRTAQATRTPGLQSSPDRAFSWWLVESPHRCVKTVKNTTHAQTSCRCENVRNGKPAHAAQQKPFPRRRRRSSNRRLPVALVQEHSAELQERKASTNAKGRTTAHVACGIAMQGQRVSPRRIRPAT